MAPVYHRKESPSQTKQEAFKERDSGELWGKTSRYGGLDPKVEAYDGGLPTDAYGIEFSTDVPPDRAGVPGSPTWSKPPATDVIDTLEPTVKIPIIVLKIVCRDGSVWIKNSA